MINAFFAVIETKKVRLGSYLYNKIYLLKVKCFRNYKDIKKRLDGSG